MSISLKSITKSFSGRTVLSDFSVQFSGGSVTCVLGPSGVGKTTLLNIMGGLVSPDAGEVHGVSANNVSYLFQEPRLLPWKTVQGNMEYVLDRIYPDKKQRDTVVARYLAVVELESFAGLFPHQLSGGMKQRVAIARAFAFPSDVLLMDEPFKGLDLHLKHGLMSAFLKLWQQDRRTVVCVTHDVDEAIRLAHNIHVLKGVPARVSSSYTISELHTSDAKYEELRRSLIVALLHGEQ